MLREAEVDAVGVCIPNHLHAQATLEALAAKKHVIVEKPIAITLSEADAMVSAAKANQRYLMVEQTQRFDPAHEVAHELLHSGAIGLVAQLRGRIGHAGPEYWSGSTKSWHIDLKQSGGGALMDVGVHIIDVLRWFSGKQIKRVCASAKTIEKRVSVEDNASVLLEFADGTMGSCEASWTTRPYEVTTHVYGERGRLQTSIGSTHPVTVHLAQRDGDPNLPLGEPSYPNVPTTSRLKGAYPYFTQCILSQQPPFISGEEGRATLEVVLAAYESIRTERWVDLPFSQRSGEGRRG